MAGLITFHLYLGRTFWMRRLMQVDLLGDKGCGVSHAPDSTFNRSSSRLVSTSVRSSYRHILHGLQLLGISPVVH